MSASVQNLQMVVTIIVDIGRLEDLLLRWEEAGSSGATVMDCIGRQQLREALRMDDVPLFPSLADLMKSEATGEKLVFTIVSNQELATRLVEISREVLEQAARSQGLVFTIPLGVAYGLGITSNP